MSTAEIISKVTSKGKVTIPKKIREKFDINSGDRINFEIREIEGKTYLTLIKVSNFSHLSKKLQKEVEKKGLDKEEVEKIIADTREKLVEDLYPDVRITVM